MYKKVLCAVAGASGGHIIPALYAIKHEAEVHDAEVLFFSTKTSFDQAMLHQFPHSFTYQSLSLSPLPGRYWWRYPQFAFSMLRACLTSYRVLRSVRPLKVLSTGGLIGVPVCMAARFLGIQVQLFELNAVPGKAVRWLAPRANTIQVCFEEAARFFNHERVEVVPYPVRFTQHDRISQHEARKLLGIDVEKKVILILGGSQGSQALNELIQQFFENYEGQDIAVIHQTGAQKVKGKDYFITWYRSQKIEAVVFDFVKDLHVSYSAADLVISRAGAGTLFELEFFNKRALLVPLELTAEAHQLENGQAMIKRSPHLFLLARQKDLEQNRSLLPTLIEKALDSSLLS